MNSLMLRTKKFDSIIEINNEYKVNGFKYAGNKILPIDEEVLNYLKLLKCSNNKIRLQSQNEYDVYLDNETNFKHFYKNGVEDAKLFFYANGTNITCYKRAPHDDRDDEYRKFEIISNRISCAMLATLSTISIFLSVLAVAKVTGRMTQSEILDVFFEDSKPIELYEVRDDIYSSSKLTDKEKEFLYNVDLISDMLESKNESSYYKALLRKRLCDLSIEGYGKENDMYSSTTGYYNIIFPNVINVANYDGLDDSNKSTVAHEAVHLWQDTSGYNTLVEATAEIIASEYFDVEIDSYDAQVYLTKILMEIIGSKPVWNYVVLGNFDMIEARVKPYLTPGEYRQFIKCLHFDRKNKEKAKQSFETLFDILNILYRNIYGSEMSDDVIIRLIANDNISLSRYYFNKRKMTEDYSYYTYDIEQEESTTYTFADAYANGLLHIYARNSVATPHHDFAITLSKEGDNEKIIERVVNTAINIKEANGKNIYYADLNGIHIENENKETVEYTLIKMNGGYYKVVELIPITYEQYKNKDYYSNDGIFIKYRGTTIDIANEMITTVNRVQSTVKVNIPTLEERENMFGEETKSSIIRN